MRNVFLAVPTRGQIQWQTVTRLEEIRDRHPGLRPILYQLGNLSVALTRNRIVRRFLGTDCDVLVMVDDDIVPPPTMLSQGLILGGFGMVAIPHPMPNPDDPSELVLTAYDYGEDGLAPVILEDGMNKVDAVATGCVAIKREVLVALGPNPFQISNDPDAATISDDFLFCKDVRSAGFMIGAWWDGWYCDHVTTVSLAPILEASMLERSTR